MCVCCAHVCPEQVQCVNTLEEVRERLIRLTALSRGAEGKPPEPGRLLAAVRSAQQAAREAGLAATRGSCSVYMCIVAPFFPPSLPPSLSLSLTVKLSLSLCVCVCVLHVCYMCVAWRRYACRATVYPTTENSTAA